MMWRDTFPRIVGQLDLGMDVDVMEYKSDDRTDIDELMAVLFKDARQEIANPTR